MRRRRGGWEEVGWEGGREERDDGVRAREGGEGGVEVGRRGDVVGASQGPTITSVSHKLLLLLLLLLLTASSTAGYILGPLRG